MKRITIREIGEEIEKAKKIAIVTHVSPDGDAAGSSLAMGLLLKKQGKEVQIFVHRRELGVVSVMEGCEHFSEPEMAAGKADLVIALDCATVARIGTPFFREKIAEFRVLNIDHHKSNEEYGEVGYVREEASSTGEIVWTIARELGWKADRTIAEALWVALVTDTGRFSYSSTSSLTFQCAGDLLTYGVRHEWLNNEIFSRVDLRILKIKERALRTLETWFGGQVAVMSLDAEDYEETGCKKADTEDFADIPRSVRGSKMAIFFYRSFAQEEKTHLSIRSTSEIDVSAFAKQFGGGGHTKAAGATLECGIEEAKERVKRSIAVGTAEQNRETSARREANS